MADVDLFADVEAKDEVDTTETDTNDESDSTDNTDEADSESTDSSESPVEVLPEIPDGCVSVTEFAALMTQHLMRKAFGDGRDFDPSDYVQPQSVYQTVGAKGEDKRIPHVLVKGEGDKEARVYIRKDEAIAWWESRKERLATRGSGSTRASSRTADENLDLLGATVEKLLWAQARLKLWTDNEEAAANRIVKYKGFLKDQKVSDETVELAIQQATDKFNAEQAEKEAAKKAKKETVKSE